MLDDMEQYPTFSPYANTLLHTPSNFASFDSFDMKRAQESIGGPETVKKARQYPPGAYDQQQQQQASYYQSQQNPSAQLYSSGVGSNGAPAMNGMQMSGMGNMAGMMNGMNGMNGMGTMNLPQHQQHQSLQQTNQIGYGQQSNGGNISPQLVAGMGIPPSPNSASLFMPQQQQLTNQQQQLGQQTPSQNQQQQQQQQQAFFQQQQMNMLNSGAMGLMPGMFGGMPMGMPFGFPMQNAFQQNPALGLNNSIMNPIQAAAAAAAGNATGRTVYIGNLPADASVDELLNLVRFGPIESVRVLPERSCVFISFLDGPTAASFHADATMKKLSLHHQELKIGWGKPSPVPSQVLLSISQSNASRNVYLGGLDAEMTEEMLRDDLGRFGLIDQVKIVRDKNIGFVHFLSISTATKVVATLPTEPAWANKRVNYGKDRCAYVPKSQQPQTPAAAHAQAVIQQAGLSPIGMSFNPFTPLNQASFGGLPQSAGFDAGGNSPGSASNNLGFAAMAAAAAAAGNGQMNRTVYIGNIHPETTIEDMCNTIRGGAIQSMRYLADKHIAFVTFIEPTAAFSFHSQATFQGLTLNNRRLKIGWGKPSGPLAPSLALSIQAGATRNVYVGNIEDFEKFSVEKLKRDFGEYGEIELVNYLKEKNCAFVNFTNISNAIKAIDGIKNKLEYANLRIAHGKDRCANAPRLNGATGMMGLAPQGVQRKASGGSPGPMLATSSTGGLTPTGGGEGGEVPESLSPHVIVSESTDDA